MFPARRVNSDLCCDRPVVELFIKFGLLLLSKWHKKVLKTLKSSFEGARNHLEIFIL